MSTLLIPLLFHQISKLLSSLLIIILLLLAGQLTAQAYHYNLDKQKDGIILGGGIAINLVAYLSLRNIEKPTLTNLNNLSPNQISTFDRSAIYNYTGRAQNLSDGLLYSSMAAPFLAYSFKNIRNEKWSVALMTFETLLINNGITTLTKSLTKRYRPFNYNPDVEIETKLSTNARLSFFSGHTSNSAAMSFLLAQVITDIKPKSKINGLIWLTAAAVPAYVGYLRTEAGKHFPTDVIAGYVVGASLGYIMPIIHRSENIDLRAVGPGISLKIQLSTNQKISRVRI